VKVYLAARYSRREELCVYRRWLIAAGAQVTSRWLDGEHQISDGQLLGSDDAAIIEGDSVALEAIELRRRFALEDWHDLHQADIVISFTEPPRSNASRGGRHVEFGAAFAIGKRCAVVGPRENVFHCMPDVAVYDDWLTCSADLARALLAEERNQVRAEVTVSSRPGVL
jgi:hypothetical protein